MRNFFDYEGPFFTVLNKISDLVILNLLWLLCCIPVVTIGASTTALYYMTMKMAENQEPYIVKGFFRSFKENFRQSTVIWLIMLAWGIFCAFDLYVAFYVPTANITEHLTFGDILMPIAFIATLLWAMILVYIFPLQSKFINPIKATFKNALVLSFAHLPSTILFILALAGVVLAVIFLTFSFPIWIMVGVAAVAFGLSFLYLRIFNIYIKKPETEDDAGDDSGIAAEDRWHIPDEYDDPTQLVSDEDPAKLVSDDDPAPLVSDDDSADPS